MHAVKHDPGRSLRPAVIFTALALGFAFLDWALIALAHKGLLPFAMGPFDLSLDGNSIPGLALECLLRVFGPLVAAFITVAYVYGRAGLRDGWRSLLRWRNPGWLYLLVFAWPLAASALIVAVGYPLGLLRFDPAQVHPLKFVIFFFIMIFLDGPLGEEPGWRGLLLPELLKHMTPLKAGLAVGVVWYLWHIPLYLADGKAVNFVGYFFNVVSLSVVFTWFYLRSGRSVFMSILLHTTTNYALFLVIKSFTLPQGIATLQIVYDVILALIAVAAAVSMHRDTPPSASAA